MPLFRPKAEGLWPKGLFREKPLGLSPSGLRLSRGSSGPLLGSLIDDLVLLHLAVECRAVQSEDLRGFLLVPVRPLECLQNGHLLDFCQRTVWRDGEILGRSPLLANLLGQIVRQDLAGLADQDGPLDRVLDFSNVAGPPVANEQVVRGR